MSRPLFAILVAAALGGIVASAPLRGQQGTDLSGTWTLNRELSQFPREIGFRVDWATGRGADPTTTAGHPPGGASTLGGLPESEDEAKRKLQLTNEVRTPPTQLTIVDTPTAVTITNDRGRSRTFRVDGRDEALQLDDVPVVVNAKRETGRLVVLFKVQQGRELRYTFSRVQDPPQLIVEVQFVERGGGDRVKRVYEPARAVETPSPPATAPTSGPAPNRPAGPTGAPPGPTPPAPAGQRAAEPFDQRPDAALIGLTTLGVVVEDLGSQAVACGLSQAAIESMVTKRLSEAGFKVRRNSDEDTYVYVNIMTASISGGLCVSRYDVSFNTQTTARLSYHDKPVLVEVSLLRKGGIAGSAAAGHPAAVLRGVQDYLDGFVARIRDANK